MPKNRKSKIRARLVPMKSKTKKRNTQKEVTLLGQALRTLGGLGGTAIGGFLGAPGTGGSIGTSLGGAISRWLGSGDYEVGRNSIVQKVEMSGSIPEMHKSDQSIIVRHREFVTTVNSSAAFAVQQSFDINPGNRLLFPWLAGIASRFQEYRVRGMVFHYIPTSGSAVASTNAALGSVMLQTSYRASDTPPLSKIELLNEYNSNESVPCEAFCHPIECDPKENPFNIQYVRTNATPANEDKLLYDLGTTHLAVSGCQTTGNPIGDLWVTFEIELKKPLISSSITTSTQSLFASYSTTNAANLFATFLSSTGSLPVSLAGNTLTFPRGMIGTYQVVVRLNGTLTALTAWANPSVTGGVALSPPGTGPTVVYTLLTAGAGVMDGPCMVFYVYVDTSQTGGTAVLSPPTLTGSLTTSLVTITPFSVV